MQFGSNGSVQLLTVRFTVNELYKFISSVHKFSVQFDYFRFGSVRFTVRFMFFLNGPKYEFLYIYRVQADIQILLFTHI
jgi:hypothetical protein